jgi:PhnB protein
MKPNPIPDNYPQLIPVIAVRDGKGAIEFYKQAFDARERTRMEDPSGKIMHAEIEIGSALLMLADKCENYNYTPEEVDGKSPIALHLYVEDVDATVESAVAAGGTVVIPVADQFYGDRSGRVRDPFGHVWLISSHIEDVSPEEMERRSAAFMESATANA